MKVLPNTIINAPVYCVEQYQNFGTLISRERFSTRKEAIKHAAEVAKPFAHTWVEVWHVVPAKAGKQGKEECIKFLRN